MRIPEIQVHRASAEDVETLVGMRVALLRAVGNVTSDLEAKEIGDAIRAYIAQEMPAGRYVAFIAEAGQCVVGCGGLVFYVRPPYCGNLSGKEVYLMGMYTIDAWRGKGVGTALLEKLPGIRQDARRGKSVAAYRATREESLRRGRLLLE
jgi:GNAT superfamily N-acetyltransferase